MNVNNVRNYCQDIWNLATKEDPNVAKSLKLFYQEGAKNPFLATLIKFDEFKKMEITEEERVIDALSRYKITQEESRQRFTRIKNSPKFISEIEKTSEIKPLFENFLKRFKKAYPKTHERRMRLIELYRINYDAVTPKAGMLRKFLLRMAKI